MRMLQINQKTKDIIRMKRTKQGKNYIWIDLLQIKGQSSGQIENAEEINEDRHTHKVSRRQWQTEEDEEEWKQTKKYVRKLS